MNAVPIHRIGKYLARGPIRPGFFFWLRKMPSEKPTFGPVVGAHRSVQSLLMHSASASGCALADSVAIARQLGPRPCKPTCPALAPLVACPPMGQHNGSLAGSCRTLHGNHFCLQYGRSVKQSEFKRWLARQGATFAEGSRHTKIYLNGRQSVMPRHPSTELGENLRRLIIRQLAIGGASTK